MKPNSLSVSSQSWRSSGASYLELYRKNKALAKANDQSGYDRTKIKDIVHLENRDGGSKTVVDYRATTSNPTLKIRTTESSETSKDDAPATFIEAREIKFQEESALGLLMVTDTLEQPHTLQMTEPVVTRTGEGERLSRDFIIDMNTGAIASKTVPFDLAAKGLVENDIDSNIKPVECFVAGDWKP